MKVGRKPIDITGKRSGSLVALRKDGVDSSNSHMWICRCDCGKEVRLRTYHINKQVSKSCGCQNPRGTIHGQASIHGSNRDIYKIWVQMLRRCNEPKDSNYKHYGARGIKVCPEWENSVERFIEDMGPRPEGYQIDRKDNNGNYCKDNCHWATRKENTRNTRKNVNITAFGKTQCISAWAEEYGMGAAQLRNRLAELDWDLEKAVAVPLDVCRGSREVANSPLEAFGETKTYSEWAKAYITTVGDITRRLKAGWTPEDAISKPIKTITRRRNNEKS